MSDLVLSQSQQVERWTSEQIDIIKQQIAPGVSDGELALFAQVCQKTGLDPFRKEVYAISRKVKDKKTGQFVDRMTIQVSIDGFRSIAAESGLYSGSRTYWCGDDGEWRDVWLSSQPPAAAKTEVYRGDSPHAFVGVAKFSSYVQEYNGKPSGLWEKMPEVMIGKCSESLALRKAFPRQLSGLYTTEEMHQADNAAASEMEIAIREQRQVMNATFARLGWDDAKKKDWALSKNGGNSASWTLDVWIEMNDLLSEELKPATKAIAELVDE